MKILTPTTSNNENYNGDCDYGLIHINKKDAEYLLELMQRAQEMKKNIEGFYNFQVFNYSVDYFSYYEALDEVTDINGTNIINYDTSVHEGVFVMPDDFTIAEDAEQRTDCDIAEIEENQIIWNSYVKHTDTKIKCMSISKKLLETIAQGK